MVHSAYSEWKAQNLNGYLTPELRPRGLRDGELDFFVRLAAKNGGPVLELASGAGRILMVLAEAGFEVFGIEASEHMLVLAKKAITLTSVDAQKRIHLIQGDMRQFAFRRKLPLIIIPYHSFWFNFDKNHEGLRDDCLLGAYHSEAEQCIQSITEALDSGGIFVIDTPRMFEESAWWDGMAKKHGFSYQVENPYEGWARPIEVLVGRKSY